MSHQSTNVNITDPFFECFKQVFPSKYRLGRNIHSSKLLLTTCLLVLFANIVSASQFRHSHREDSNINSIRKNCTKCSLLLEDAKFRRLEEFKREFLHKLGFKEAPKVTVDKSLYNIPPLDSLFTRKNSKSFPFNHDIMLGDEPFNMAKNNGQFEEEDFNNDMDDSTGSIKKFISFARIREFYSLSIYFFTMLVFRKMETI